MSSQPDVMVKHYTEVLMFPFRLADKTQAFAPMALSRNEVIECLTQSTSAGLWQQLPHWQMQALNLQGEPLQSANDTNSDTQPNWTDWQNYQALAYFHPALRSFLFGSETLKNANATEKQEGNQFLTVFRHQKIAWLKLCMKSWSGPQWFYFKVVRCDLLWMNSDTGVLQLELCWRPSPTGTRENNAPHTSDEPHDCNNKRTTEPALNLNDLLNLRDTLRRVYPPYLEEQMNWDTKQVTGYCGGHSPLSMCWLDAQLQPLHPVPQTPEGDNQPPSAAHMLPFLKKTFTEQNTLPRDVEQGPALFEAWQYVLQPLTQKFKLIADSDERLPMMAYLAVDAPRRITCGQWVRLAFADAAGSDRLPYAQHFLRDFEAKHCYDRYWYKPHESGDAPSRFVNSGYALAYVGTAGDSFFCNERNGAYSTFRQIYARMGAVLLYQKAAIHSTLSRLSWLTNVGLSAKQGETRFESGQSLYQEFLDFTRIYWFLEVSPQLQGIELFQQWQGLLRLPQSYSELRQELNDYVMFLNAQANHKQAQAANKLARQATRLTHVATWFGGAGLVAGLLGMNVWPIDNGLWPTDASIHWVSAFLSVGLAALGISLAYLIYRFAMKRADDLMDKAP